MTDDFLIPDYTGGSLVNLIAELERRLTGSAPHPGLHPDLAASIPQADSYVLVLFDGLGDHQLAHPAAASLRADRVGAIDAGWPTTTTVSMATVATGLTPAEHGLLGYQIRIPEIGHVVNTIKWTTQWGERIDYDLWGFLPTPNLWERLASHGIEPVTLQPWNFDDSPMSRMLYRGCRFERWNDADEGADIAAELAAVPGRLVFFYLPHIDFAAHVAGQESADFAVAITIAARMWERLVRLVGGSNTPHRPLSERPTPPQGGSDKTNASTPSQGGQVPRLRRGSTPHRPAGGRSAPPQGGSDQKNRVVVIGTADHGHVDIPKDRRIDIPKAAHEDRDFGGDPRAPFVYGEVASLAAELGVDWLPREEMEHWWGPGTRHPGFAGRAPDGVLLPPPGWVVLHRHADERLIGHHGGLTNEELRIPLLVATRD